MASTIQSKVKTPSNVHRLHLVQQTRQESPGRFLDYVSNAELALLTQLRAQRGDLFKLIQSFSSMDLEEQAILLDFALVRAAKTLAEKKEASVFRLLPGSKARPATKSRNGEREPS